MLKLYAKNLETAVILCLEGRIVSGETYILRNSMDSLRETSAVILDLARVTIVDAHGLGVMLKLRERAQEKAIRFELMNVSEPLSRVLQISRGSILFSKFVRGLSSLRRFRITWNNEWQPPSSVFSPAYSTFTRPLAQTHNEHLLCFLFVMTYYRSQFLAQRTYSSFIRSRSAFSPPRGPDWETWSCCATVVQFFSR